MRVQIVSRSRRARGERRGCVSSVATTFLALLPNLGEHFFCWDAFAGVEFRLAFGDSSLNLFPVLALLAGLRRDVGVFPNED